jgi:hypothetical protein
MRRTMVAVISAITLVWSAVPAMATLTPVKVMGGPGEQHSPSSNGTYLAWTTYVNNTLNVYVKTLPDGAPERVNQAGTSAEIATFIGSSNVLVYEQWSRTARGDLYFYDVSTGARTEAPAAVNSSRTWEFSPMASDNFLLFERFKWSYSGTLLESALLLYERNSGVITTLEEGQSNYYRPTFAGATYVAWTVCGSVGCAIHYWSAEGGEQVQPSVPGRDQYSAWIDEATEQVYYVRAKPPTCGKLVTIRRSTLGSSASTLLASLPRGIDTGENLSLATDLATSGQDLYFERWSCRRETGDIYALEGVDIV